MILACSLNDANNKNSKKEMHLTYVFANKYSINETKKNNMQLDVKRIVTYEAETL